MLFIKKVVYFPVGLSLFILVVWLADTEADSEPLRTAHVHHILSEGVLRSTCSCALFQHTAHFATFKVDSLRVYKLYSHTSHKVVCTCACIYCVYVCSFVVEHSGV